MRPSDLFPLAAALPWRPVASLTGVGVALFAAVATWPTSSVSRLALTVGLGALSAATAFVLDEAAAEAVAATPTSLRRRDGARIVCAAAVLGFGVIGLLVVVGRSDGDIRPGFAVPLAGCVLVAVAASAGLRRRVAEPGELVGSALLALVVALAIARPLERWVDLFPTDAAQRWGGSLIVWAAASLLSLVVITRALRDPLS